MRCLATSCSSLVRPKLFSKNIFPFRIGTRILDVVEREQRSSVNSRHSSFLPSPTDKEGVHAPIEVCYFRIFEFRAQFGPESVKKSGTGNLKKAFFQIRRRTVMHASTSDLLRGIGRFVVKKAKVRLFIRFRTEFPRAFFEFLSCFTFESTKEKTVQKCSSGYHYAAK